MEITALGFSLTLRVDVLEVCPDAYGSCPSLRFPRINAPESARHIWDRASPRDRGQLLGANRFTELSAWPCAYRMLFFVSQTVVPRVASPQRSHALQSTTRHGRTGSDQSYLRACPPTPSLFSEITFPYHLPFSFPFAHGSSYPTRLLGRTR